MKPLLNSQNDRVLAASHQAPIAEGTPEEIAAYEEGLADIRGGRTVSAERVRAQLLARERE